MVESGLLSVRIFLAKLHWKMVKKIFDIDSVLKTNPWTDKIKIEDLKGQKILRSFYEKELSLSKLSMSY